MWSAPERCCSHASNDMAVEVALIVADAPPVITLAAAQSLDYLLYPDLFVIIPDAMFYEATSQIDKLGAQAIIDWQRARHATVQIEPTEAFKNELQRLARQGGRIERDLGERAAVEIIRNFPLAETECAILLSDDRDVDRVVVVDPERIILLTTWDYLRQLEEAQRIQSADAVFEAARATGRNPPTRDVWSQHDPEIRDAVREAIASAHRKPRSKR
jgi:hypothetical protein